MHPTSPLQSRDILISRSKQRMLHHVCGWTVLGCKCLPFWME